MLITTAMERSDPTLACLKSRFDELGLAVHSLQTFSRAEKVRELSSLIGALRPQVVMLLAHPDDCVAYTGIAGRSAPRVIFLHHADHIPSLGASRSDYVHLDLTPACHAVCASNADLHPSMLNLTVKDIGSVEIVERNSIIGVTSGSAHKYTGVVEFSYAQLLARLFSSGVARVFHIGDMSASQKDQISADIATTGQDPSKIVFLGSAPSVAAKMIELAPDFYVTSHPIGGGKAMIEAMSVGLPILYVRPAGTSPLYADLSLGSSVPISNLEAIAAAVHRLKIEKKTMASRSRRTYEEHYSQSAFRDGLLSIIGTDR